MGIKKDKDDKSFIKTLRDLNEFCKSNKRFPNLSSKNNNERFLAGFVVSKKQAFKKGLSMHRKEDFFTTMKEIDNYFKKNNIKVVAESGARQINRSFDEWLLLLKEYVNKSNLDHVVSSVIVKDKNNNNAALGTWWHNNIRAKYKRKELNVSQEIILRDMGMNLDI